MALVEVQFGTRGVCVSERGTKVIPLDRVWYGHDCTIPMIVYTNPEPTQDKPAWHRWVLEEDLFLKQFTAVND